ncbi:MAG: hypothetical protein LBG28_00275 [Tannerella sp.]|nr:hypothetical protein [Tannerella sp.]
MNKLLIRSATFILAMFGLYAETPAGRYLRLQRNLTSGWNTGTYSVMNHVWLQVLSPGRFVGVYFINRKRIC